MEQIISPVVLYAACALGAVGLVLALPRRGTAAQILGALVAATAGGLALLGLAIKNPDALPNIFFYVFALLALGSALRVVTHPRPVYAALYFILTILSSAGLFVLLSAEFMAFALIIVYAGAILITYLFVIMLATQAPSEDQVETLADYDATAREPVVAAGAGFLLLAVLTTLLYTGVPSLPAPVAVTGDSVLARMPRKIERDMRREGLIDRTQSIVRTEEGLAAVDGARGMVAIEDSDGVRRERELPSATTSRNVERVGFTLIGEHPGAIEIAGVILLMAMLGAVVLSRKQVDLDEESKRLQSRHLSDSGTEGSA